MLVAGFSLDNLSLMAMSIAVGFVVDDAIVMVEVIWRRIEEGDNAVGGGARRRPAEVGFTILSISISLIAVFYAADVHGRGGRTIDARVRASP